MQLRHSQQTWRWLTSSVDPQKSVISPIQLTRICYQTLWHFLKGCVWMIWLLYRHQSNNRWDKLHIFVRIICTYPQYCWSGCCSGKRHPNCRLCLQLSHKNDVDALNGNLESTPDFLLENCLARLGWELIASVILFCTCNCFPFHLRIQKFLINFFQPELWQQILWNSHSAEPVNHQTLMNLSADAVAVLPLDRPELLSSFPTGPSPMLLQQALQWKHRLELTWSFLWKNHTWTCSNALIVLIKIFPSINKQLEAS